MKKILLFILLLNSASVFSQRGKLIISLYRNEFTYEDSIRCTLKDSLDNPVVSNGFDGNDALTFDSLLIGKYAFYLYVNDHLNAIYTNIRIKSEKSTTINVMANKQTYRSLVEEPDTTRYEPDQYETNETTLFMQYGPNYNPNDASGMLNDSYRMGFSQGYYNIPAKHYAIGIIFGSDMGMTRFSNGKSMDSIPHDRERYFYWNGNLCLMNRFTFFNYKGYESEGLTLDIGAQYSLPFLFRHVQADGSNKIVHHWIHQYTDVSGIVRLGFKQVALQADYHFLNFILGDYPEIPPLTLGLALLIQDY